MRVAKEKVLVSIMSRLNRYFSHLKESLSSRSNKKVVQAKVLAEMYIMQKGLKKFGEQGVAAAKSELSKIHHRSCFRQ